MNEYQKKIAVAMSISDEMAASLGWVTQIIGRDEAYDVREEVTGFYAAPYSDHPSSRYMLGGIFRGSDVSLCKTDLKDDCCIGITGPDLDTMIEKWKKSFRYGVRYSDKIVAGISARTDG